jgi:hypothetical protein
VLTKAEHGLNEDRLNSPFWATFGAGFAIRSLGVGGSASRGNTHCRVEFHKPSAWRGIACSLAPLMKVLLVAFVACAPLSSLHAEELRLICGDALYFVDTAGLVIRDGRTGEVQWQNGTFYKTEDQSDTNYPACKVRVDEYVRVSKQEIAFGFKSVYLNNCGASDNRRGSVGQSANYTIDRITGSASFGDGRCQRYEGPAL